MGMQKKTMVLGGGVVCAVAGLVTWAWLDGRSGVQYRTATVEHGDINVTISATGNPNAVVTVQVGSQVSGIILALFADFNTRVTKGELIARDRSRALPGEGQSGTGQPRCRAGRRRQQPGRRPAGAGGHSGRHSSLAAAQANVVKAEAITEDAKVKVDRRVIMVETGRGRQRGS